MRSTRTRLPGAWCLIWLLLASLLVGCSDAGIQGQELAARGMATADQATAYYTALEVATLRTIEFQYLLKGLGSQSPHKDLLEIYNRRLHAIRARKELVATLKETYQSLNDLSAYDARGQIQTSATALTDALTSVQAAAFPGLGPVEYFKDGLVMIGAARKNADVREGAHALEQVVSELLEMMQKEIVETAPGLYESACNSIFSRYQKVVTLWQRGAGSAGILDYETMVNERIKLYGWRVDLKPKAGLPEGEETVRKNTIEGLRKNIPAYQTYLVSSEVAELKAQGLDLVEATDKLLKDHKKLFPNRRPTKVSGQNAGRQ